MTATQMQPALTTLDLTHVPAKLVTMVMGKLVQVGGLLTTLQVYKQDINCSSLSNTLILYMFCLNQRAQLNRNWAICLIIIWFKAPSPMSLNNIL